MKTFDKQFWGIFIPLLAFIGLILFLPALITQHSFFNLDFSETGSIGDTLGGILGPFIAIAAAILTFFAFWVQYKANEQQKNASEQQKKDLKIERFESRFFEMIRLHKENINEINIEGYEWATEEQKEMRKSTYAGATAASSNPPSKRISKGKVRIDIIGRRAIDDINTEIRAAYEICNDLLSKKKISSKNRELDEDEKKQYCFKIAYTFVFLGIFTNTIHFIDKNMDQDEDCLKNCRKRLCNVRNEYVHQQRIIDLINSQNKVNLTIKFPPFEGHTAQLGHYFRHLFQTVKYVVKQDDLIKYSEKRDYLRMLRAQLSNPEQLLLYFNYLGGFGKKWENQEFKFLTDYRMIHNLPILEAQFCINPLDEFKEQIQMAKENGDALFEQLETMN